MSYEGRQDPPIDVEVDQIAGVLVLVAPGWLGGLQCAQAVPALASQGAADAGPRDPGEGGDPIHGPAPALQGDHLPLGSPRLAPRPGRAVCKPGTTDFLEPLDPTLNRFRIRANGTVRRPKAQAVIHDPTGHLLSTAGPINAW